MDQAQYDKLRSRDDVTDAVVLSVDDVAGPDRTLIFGYNIDSSDTMHVYLKDGELHFVLSAGAEGQRGGVLRYEHGKTLPAEMLRPSKRAYPARTDYAAAVRMASLGYGLIFTTFKEEELEKVKDGGFYGMVVNSYEQSA